VLLQALAAWAFLFLTREQTRAVRRGKGSVPMSKDKKAAYAEKQKAAAVVRQLTPLTGDTTPAGAEKKGKPRKQSRGK
jgi:hypothetical protein